MKSASVELPQKEALLRELLAGYGSIALAYSGGVDSTYLADVAYEVLDERLFLLIADSPSLPRHELREALELAATRGWRVETRATNEFHHEDFLNNNGARCYWCKTELFRVLRQYAEQHGAAVIAYGENADDGLDTTRVGHQAARACGAVAPLREAGLTKDDIRTLSRNRGLPTSDKPAFACLASRFPTGIPVSVEGTRQVELVEDALRAHGFQQYRARHHGDVCRIEVDLADIARLLEPDVRDSVAQAALQAGFRFVAADLLGYRMGGSASMPIANSHGEVAPI